MTLRPMLASPMTETITGEAFDRRFTTGWALEEKLDGHRVTVTVRGRGKHAVVTGYSRPQRNREPLGRALPPEMTRMLAVMGDGDYDGELMATTGKAWDVVRKTAQLVYVAFDILTCNGVSTMELDYETRRARLLERLGKLPSGQQSVSTVVSLTPTWREVQTIWQRGGEGAILKRLGSRYQPGYRSPDWLKVKAEHSAVLTIVGYEAGKSGPYSAIRLRDAGGIETTVKTLGHKLLRDITAAPHAFLGRAVVIAYQERTPDGLYRHGRFDHFKE